MVIPRDVDRFWPGRTALAAASDADALEAEGARGTRLLGIVCGEDEGGIPPLPPEHGAREGGARRDDHRASRSSRRRRTTSTGRFGRTPQTFLSSPVGRDAGSTWKPSSSSASYGTSRAIGVVRSQTTTDCPRRTSAR